MILNQEIKKDTPAKDKAVLHQKPEKVRKINPYIIEKLYKEIQEKEKQIKSNKVRIEELHMLFSDSATFSDTQKVKQINAEIEQITQKIKIQQEELDEMELKYLEMTE